MEYNIGALKGTIIMSSPRQYYWRYDMEGPNDLPFSMLGITSMQNKRDYITGILGYIPTIGNFPYCKTPEDVKKVCDSLTIDLSEQVDSFTINGVSGKIDHDHMGYFLNIGHTTLPNGNDCRDIQKSTLGYETHHGLFPYCKSKQDLIKFCIAIEQHWVTSRFMVEPEIESHKEFSFLIEVGDFVKITKSPKNWTESMDKYDGKVVQVTNVSISSSNTVIQFPDCGSWEWSLRDKHFTKQILSPVGEPTSFVSIFGNSSALSSLEEVPTLIKEKLGSSPVLINVYKI